MRAEPILVGREDERAILRSLVDRAAGGEPGVLLVHGEAGIGKTSLVREAAEAARSEGMHVLVGQCLRFGADVTSYVPFTQALTHWLRTTTGESRDRLAPHGTLDDLVPALNDANNGLALLQIGAVLDQLQVGRPTVLVLDDLQWSDPSSLDVLSYLVAGFVPGQRLGIVATYRDTDLGEGHRLHGWLADALRMPSVSRIAVGRMDAWGLEEMVVARGGDAGLAQEVLRRSGGNPYLAELLLRPAGSATAHTGPQGVRLEDALLASWHRLSAPGRRVTQLLAVSGAPVALPVLRNLAARHALPPEDTTMALAEASVEGITIETDSGAVWFRHPLLAETVAGTLGSLDRAELHGDLAAEWRSAVGVDERDRANFLTLHHLAAGEVDAGFTWSLRAADEAAAIRARDEEATHLSTAVSLLPRLSDEAAADVDAVGLLLRAARVSKSGGDGREAVVYYENALTLVQQAEGEPLLAARIVLDLHLLRLVAGIGPPAMSLVEPREALSLTEGAPGSPERALALAHLAFAEVFSGLPEASGHAEEAVRIAEAGDSPEAMLWALGARAQTRWGTEEGVTDAERSFALASTLDDPQLLSQAAVFLSNSYGSVGRHADAAATTARAYRSLRDTGDVNFAAMIGVFSAFGALALGRWSEVRPLVRELLTLARSGVAAGPVRCVAALLSAREGNLAAARLHLRRAEELMPNEAPIGGVLASTQIEVGIALGDAKEALERIGAHMSEAVRIDVGAADEWLELASQAALQLAERAGGGADPLAAVHRLEAIEAQRGTRPPPFRPAGPQDTVSEARGALYAAQRAQCAGEVQVLEQLWGTACEQTSRADLPFEHARALYRLARHLLVHRVDSRRAAAALAEARRIADELGAAPLVDDIDTLATQTHVRLPATGTAEVADPHPPLGEWVDAPLTPREREILDGLLAGDTYAQIASHLFISEKTVSSHVSNLLRKTGTTSRIELAALANRRRVADGA